MEQDSGMEMSVALAVNPNRYEVTDLICSDCRDKIIKELRGEGNPAEGGAQ
jgi:hypothetical protein